MRRSELFRALADLVLYGDFDELGTEAVSTTYGEDAVRNWIAWAPEDIEEDLNQLLGIVEALLRLAKGAGLPKEVGMDVERRKVNEWAEPLREGVWFVDLPQPDRPGEFHTEHTGDLASSLAICEQWFPGNGEEALRLLGTRREKDERDEEEDGEDGEAGEGGD